MPTLPVTPFEQAKAVYEAEPCARSFDEDLQWHFLNGYVFSTPTYFVMGRPVCSKAAHDLIVNPAITFPMDDCDCWHLYLMAGDMPAIFQLAPYHLPLVSFERRNELRFYPHGSLRRLTA